MKTYGVALSLAYALLTSTAAHGRPEATTVCGILKQDAHDLAGKTFSVMAKVSPTMHSGLQLYDDACRDKRLALVDVPDDASMQQALKGAFQERLYDRPYRLQVDGRLGLKDGRLVIQASSIVLHRTP